MKEIQPRQVRFTGTKSSTKFEPFSAVVEQARVWLQSQAVSNQSKNVHYHNSSAFSSLTNLKSLWLSSRGMCGSNTAVICQNDIGVGGVGLGMIVWTPTLSLSPTSLSPHCPPLSVLIFPLRSSSAFSIQPLFSLSSLLLILLSLSAHTLTSRSNNSLLALSLPSRYHPSRPTLSLSLWHLPLQSFSLSALSLASHYPRHAHPLSLCGISRSNYSLSSLSPLLLTIPVTLTISLALSFSLSFSSHTLTSYSNHSLTPLSPLLPTFIQSRSNLYRSLCLSLSRLTLTSSSNRSLSPLPLSHHSHPRSNHSLSPLSHLLPTIPRHATITLSPSSLPWFSPSPVHGIFNAGK